MLWHLRNNVIHLLIRGWLIVSFFIMNPFLVRQTDAQPINEGLAEEELMNLLQQSPFIFEGRVKNLGAVSSREIPVSEKTIVVEVMEILQSPKTIGTYYKGKEVTVRVHDLTVLKVNDRVTFFTKIWLMGKGLAVEELRHFNKGVVTVQRLEQTKQARRDLSLAKRLQKAQSVVVGKVVEIHSETATTLRALRESGEGTKRPKIITEHDPQWMEAIIKVASGLKGAQADQEIVVRFPGSRDVAWERAPKFQEGEEGVFILRSDQVSGTSRAMLHNQEVEAFTALDAEDVLPVQEAERVQRLIAP